MRTERKLKTCVISLIIIVSSLSIFTVNSAKAQVGDGNSTVLYFHNTPFESDIDTVSLLNSIMVDKIGEEGFLEILTNLSMDPSSGEMDISSLVDVLKTTLTTYPEFIWSFANNSNIKTLSTSPPSKTNISEYPPSFDLNKLLSGDLFNTTEDLLSIATSLAPLPSLYIYDGEEKVQLNGDVDFSLYFNRPMSYLWNSGDEIEVSFSVYSIDTDGYGNMFSEYSIENEYEKSTTFTVKKEPLSGDIFKEIEQYEVSINIDEEVELEPMDIVFVEIQRQAGDKPILKSLADQYKGVVNLTEIADTLQYYGESLLNISIPIISNIPIITVIGEELVNISNLIRETSEMFDESDLVELIYVVLNELISSTFVYDSIFYPSYVSIPCSLDFGYEENTKVYYLHDLEGVNTLSTIEPTGTDSSSVNLLKNEGVWNGSNDLARYKILKSGTASLYLNYRDLVSLINLIRGKITVNADLYDAGELISTSQKVLDRTTILDLFEKPEAVSFSFDDINDEVRNNDELSLKVYVENNTRSGLGIYRSVKLLYDSIENPSSVTLNYEETDHINIVDINGQELDDDEIYEGIIAAGETTELLLNIHSEYDDTLELDVKNYDNDNWDVRYPQGSIDVSAGSTTAITMYVDSKNNSLSAYDGEFVDIKITVMGTTGLNTKKAHIVVSPDAVEYDAEIDAPPDKSIRHGESDSYIFRLINRNTGLWPDNYTVEVISEHDWKVEYPQYIENVENYEINSTMVEFEVKVSVPEFTEVNEDKLTVILYSNESGLESIFMVNVTTEVIEPTIFEHIYHFFDSAADSVGFDAIFGDYAGAFLIFIIIFLVIFFLALALVLANRSYIEVVCLDRVREISAGSTAEYGIAVHNPSSRRLTYEVYIERMSESTAWEVAVDAESFVIEPKESRVVTLMVKPNDMVEPEDWAEFKVSVRVLEKQKIKEITTVTTISDEKPELNIKSIFHWPKVFRAGEKVTTSFKLENKGKVAAKKVTVILYVNGEEKNKVEDLNIPGGGYAEIEMPWIASEGKNDVDIEVKEE